ncbi:MAG TPA: hypothetical protein VM369_08150 [Candidatus Binatia bacterium]|nr:hypothetical protein [Candidatus Binatia bacterium]
MLLRVAVALAVLLPGLAAAKPIAFQDAVATSFEYRPWMQRVESYYTPDVHLSLGGGFLHLDAVSASGGGHHHGGSQPSRDIGYLRLNVLAERWNLPQAQGNWFLWGGLGAAHDAARSAMLVPNFGSQFDFETRRLYFSARTDWHYAFTFREGDHQVQFAVAPYLHSYDGLATWIVLDGHAMTGSVRHDPVAALLLRFFWHRVWLEGGADQNGEFVGTLMFTL